MRRLPHAVAIEIYPHHPVISKQTHSCRSALICEMLNGWIASSSNECCEISPNGGIALGKGVTKCVSWLEAIELWWWEWQSHDPSIFRQGWTCDEGCSKSFFIQSLIVAVMSSGFEMLPVSMSLWPLQTFSLHDNISLNPFQAFSLKTYKLTDFFAARKL